MATPFRIALTPYAREPDGVPFVPVSRNKRDMADARMQQASLSRQRSRGKLGRRDKLMAGTDRTGKRVKAKKTKAARGPEWADGLKQLYDSVIDEPLPDAFKDLLAKLDDDAR
jgi:hypothetical protein